MRRLVPAQTPPTLRARAVDSIYHLPRYQKYFESHGLREGVFAAYDDEVR